MTKNKASKINYKNIIIGLMILGVLAIPINMYLRINNQSTSTLIDESLISFFAFALLILTALMQNKDLNLQRQELEATKEEIKKSAKAQIEQKDELEKSNKLVIQNIKQAQFYELLRMKDNIFSKLEIENFNDINSGLLYKIYQDVIKVWSKDYNFNYIISSREFDSSRISPANLNYIKEHDPNVYNNMQDNFVIAYTDFICNSLNSTFRRMYKIDISIHRLLNNYVDEKQIYDTYNVVDNNVDPNKELELKDIHKSLKVENEGEFYLIVSGNMTLEDFIRLRYKY